MDDASQFVRTWKLEAKYADKPRAIQHQIEEIIIVSFSPSSTANEVTNRKIDYF